MKLTSFYFLDTTPFEHLVRNVSAKQRHVIGHISFKNNDFVVQDCSDVKVAPARLRADAGSLARDE